MNHIERREGIDFLEGVRGLPPLLPRSDMSAVSMMMARRSFGDVTRLGDEFLEVASPAVLSLDELKRSVINLQIYRERQSKTLVEGLEISDRWEERIRASSDVVISCFSELKIEFPRIYNSIIEQIYSDLKKDSPIEESCSVSLAVLGDLVDEFSMHNIIDKIEMEEGFSFFKRAEFHVVNCLRSGELQLSSVIKAITKERNLQANSSPSMENVLFQIFEEEDELDVVPSVNILPKPVSRGSNFSLTSLWQRVTGSTPVTVASSSRSSSCKISPINF